MSIPALIPINDAHECYALLDALVAFAYENDLTDPTTARMCDDIAERVRPMLDLLTRDAAQHVAHMGLDRYKHRPQG